MLDLIHCLVLCLVLFLAFSPPSYGVLAAELRRAFGQGTALFLPIIITLTSPSSVTQHVVTVVADCPVWSGLFLRGAYEGLTRHFRGAGLTAVTARVAIRRTSVLQQIRRNGTP